MTPAPRHVMISRTDSIGDVILTLPLARILKTQYPGCRISFLGKAYTRAVIETCAFVDAFVDLEDFMSPSFKSIPDTILHVFPVKEIARRAKALGIPVRIGTTGRLYHWTTCNRLVRLSRKNSDLHEAQLNTVLLGPLGIKRMFSPEELGDSFGMTKLTALPSGLQALIAPGKFNLILHPKSQGSAREWGLANFAALVRQLPPERFQIFISGTAKERESLGGLLAEVAGAPNVQDVCGLMDLATFIAFIHACDGLVANSTGPLHIAAALGKRAIGIYPPLRPMHPGRWRPLGPQAAFLVADKTCAACRKDPASCSCMTAITPADVAAMLPGN